MVNVSIILHQAELCIESCKRGWPRGEKLECCLQQVQFLGVKDMLWGAFE